jgi:hypothetical protein
MIDRASWLVIPEWPSARCVHVMLGNVGSYPGMAVEAKMGHVLLAFPWLPAVSLAG